MSGRPMRRRRNIQFAQEPQYQPIPQRLKREQLNSYLYWLYGIILLLLVILIFAKMNVWITGTFGTPLIIAILIASSAVAFTYSINNYGNLGNFIGLGIQLLIVIGLFLL